MGINDAEDCGVCCTESDVVLLVQLRIGCGDALLAIDDFPMRMYCLFRLIQRADAEIYGPEAG